MYRLEMNQSKIKSENILRATAAGRLAHPNWQFNDPGWISVIC